MSRLKTDYRNAIRVEPNISRARGRIWLSFWTPSSRLDAGSRNVDKVALKRPSRLRKEEHELLKIDVQRAKDLPNTHALHYGYAMSAYVTRATTTKPKST